MSQRKDFIKDTFVYGLGSGIKKFIGLFLLPFYTRALTPADYGILETIGTSIFFVSAFLNMGLDSASGFYFFKGKDDKEKGEILFTLFILRIVTAIPALILSFFSSDISLALFGSEEYTSVIFISCIFIPISLINSEQSHIYRFYRSPWKYNIVTIIQSLTSIIAGISLVVILKYGVLGAQIASVISSSAVVIFSFLTYTRYKYTYNFSFFWAKKMIRYGFPLIWAGIAAWFYVSSDRYFLLYYHDLKDIGYYSMGATFSQPIGLISMAVQMSFGIIFLSEYNKEENPRKPGSKKLVKDIFSLYLFVTVIIASFLSIFGTDLINTITTPDYIFGALAIPFLSFSAIFEQSVQLTHVGIILTEKTWYFTILILITAVFNIIVNFLFIPKFSFVGAGLATLLSFVLYWSLVYNLSQKFFKVDHNIIKLLTFVIISFSASCLIPFFQIYGNMHINVFLKSGLFVLLLALPFALKIVTYREASNYIMGIVKYRNNNEK